MSYSESRTFQMADDSPTRAGPRRRVGRPTAAARRDRLRGRERQAAHMAARIVEQLECTVPGTVHSLRLDTFSSHMRVDIVLNRDRLGGRGSGEGGVGDDAGAPTGASEEAQRPWRRSHSTAATAAQPSRASRQPPPPAGRRPQRQQQPSQTHKVTPAPQERTAPATAPERTAAVEHSQGLWANVKVCVRTLGLTLPEGYCSNVLTPLLARCWGVLTPSLPILTPPITPFTAPSLLKPLKRLVFLHRNA